jgi:hypothetical protein
MNVTIRYEILSIYVHMNARARAHTHIYKEVLQNHLCIGLGDYKNKQEKYFTCLQRPDLTVS